MARRGAAKMSQDVGGWALLGKLGGRAGEMEWRLIVLGLKVRRGVEIRKAIQRSVIGIGIPFEEYMGCCRSDTGLYGLSPKSVTKKISDFVSGKGTQGTYTLTS